MPRVKGTVDIDRPADQVFAALADLRNLPAWDPPVRRADLLGSEVGLGAEFEAHLSLVGRTRLRISRFEPSSELGFEGENRLAVVHDDIRVTATGDRSCRVDVVATVTLVRPLSFLDVLAKPFGAALGRWSSRRLKHWVESRPDPNRSIPVQPPGGRRT